MADLAVFRPIVLFAGAESTEKDLTLAPRLRGTLEGDRQVRWKIFRVDVPDHTVRVLVWMVAFEIVASGEQYEMESNENASEEGERDLRRRTCRKRKPWSNS